MTAGGPKALPRRLVAGGVASPARHAARAGRPGIARRRSGGRSANHDDDIAERTT